IQIVQMRQVGSQKEALVRLEPPFPGLLQLRPLFPELATGQASERGWIGLSSQQGLSPGPRARAAGDMGDHRRKLEGGSAEQFVPPVDQAGPLGPQGAPITGQLPQLALSEGRDETGARATRACLRSAIHSASVLAVLWPGPAFTWWALARR